MQRFFYSKQAAKQGFSLMEVIVATALLAVIVSGVMRVIYQSSTAGRFQKDRIIATYLAGEAIEFVRADRDGVLLEDTGNSFSDWKSESGLYNDCNGNTCRIDARPSENSWQECSGEGCRLSYNTTNRLYGYESGSSWEESRFFRQVNISTANGGDEVVIEAVVTWVRPGGETSNITFRESIFNWR